MKRFIPYLCGLCLVILSCTQSEATTPDIAITPEVLNFSAEGGEQEVTITANFEYDVNTNASWLSYTKKDNGLTIFVTPSNVEKKRKAYILISNLKFNISRMIMVTQDAYIAPIHTEGWAEMPAIMQAPHLEYGYHHKLPSNNRLRNYSFCFDKEKYCALWVAYPLHKCYIEGDGHRTEDWEYDPCCIEDKYEPDLQNAYYPQNGDKYSHSRGHQLPSADRLASDEDNATTFYFTNMTPQLQSLNGGTWASLEGDITNQWICSDTLYVVTGAHFAEGYGYAYDNKGFGKACAVPTHYYKVILRTKSGNSGKWVGDCSASELKCAGFWFEHKGGAPRQTMSVAEIEQKTGLTFFPNVPNAPKNIYNSSEW